MNIEERVKALEVVTKRLSRRSKKVASGMITPYPISSYTEGDNISGKVLAYVFPCDGQIKKGLVDFGRKLKTPVIVSIEISDGQNTQMKSFPVERRLVLDDFTADVFTGSKIEVSIDAEDANIKNVSVAFLWVPTVRDVEVRAFLIDELDNVEKSVE